MNSQKRISPTSRRIILQPIRIIAGRREGGWF